MRMRKMTTRTFKCNNKKKKKIMIKKEIVTVHTIFTNNQNVHVDGQCMTILNLMS